MPGVLQERYDEGSARMVEFCLGLSVGHDHVVTTRGAREVARRVMTELDACRSTFQDCCVVFYDRAHLVIGGGLLSGRQTEGRDVWAVVMMAMGKAAIEHASTNGLSL